MVKINTGIFFVCLIFVLFFLWCIYQTFTKELEIRNQKNRLRKGLLHNNSNELEIHLTTEEVEIEKLSEEDDTMGYPPCQSFGSMRWFHDTMNGECYEVGQMGPCGDSMTFYQHPRKYFANIGFCDCDDVVEVKSYIPGCDMVERPLVYYPPKDRCYTVFSQGPCNKDEWLILDKLFHPICETNPCIHKGQEDDEFSLDFWIEHERKCFKTMTRGYCEKGNILKTTKNNWKPECQKDTLGKCPQTSFVSIPALQCRPGNRIHQLGMCNLL